MYMVINTIDHWAWTSFCKCISLCNIPKLLHNSKNINQSSTQLMTTFIIITIIHFPHSTDHNFGIHKVKGAIFYIKESFYSLLTSFH